jgi:hypothetical protein
MSGRYEIFGRTAQSWLAFGPQVPIMSLIGPDSELAESPLFWSGPSVDMSIKVVSQSTLEHQIRSHTKPNGLSGQKWREWLVLDVAMIYQLRIFRIGPTRSPETYIQPVARDGTPPYSMLRLAMQSWN